MGIFIFAVVFFFFEKRIRQNGAKAFLIINAVFISYIIFSIILNDYQESVYKWQYGVPGADLTAHFEGAYALAHGVKIKDLHNVAYRFTLSLSGITYIIYAIILQIISFSPIIISYRFSLHLMYTIQIMLAILAADNLCRTFPSKKNSYNYALFFAITSCVCIAQQASILMRDIWIFFALTLLFLNNFDSLKSKIEAFIIITLCALLRFYTIILTVPFFVWKYTKQARKGVLASLIIMSFFAFGQNFISAFASWFGIKWEFGFNYDFRSILVYILFPNIINQTYNVQHLVAGYHANFGGNTEWIYYMLACWNCYIYPVAAFGIYKFFTSKKDVSQGYIWLSQIVNIGLLYSIFYSSVSEPRHKLLIIFGLLFFFNEGIKKMSVLAKALYFTVITMFLLGLMLLVG